MTLIVRHKDTIYFDDLVLIASHAGGTFGTSLHHKLYKHPSYNALIGVSGTLNQGEWNLMEGVINQWLTTLKEDPDAGLDTEPLKNKIFTNLVTIGIFCRDFNIVFDWNGEGRRPMSVFKLSSKRIFAIGSHQDLSAYNKTAERLFDKDPVNALQQFTLLSPYVSTKFKSVDISGLGAL